MSKQIPIHAGGIILAGGQNIGCGILRFLADNDHQVSGIIARMDDTGNDGVFPSLIKLARELGIPVIQPADVNASEVYDFIFQREPRILLSAAYNKIFQQNIINFFEPSPELGAQLGVINIHYGPLPRYGGWWPEMWAIFNDERDFALTFHYIDGGVDSGNIIYQPKVEIEREETRSSLYKKCDKIALQTFIEHHQKLLTARQPSTPQDVSRKSYYRRELPNNGVLNFGWDDDKIERFIRAVSFYPFVGAKIHIGGKIYSIVDKDLEFFKPHWID
jgi:methionyl-tRNA formyltransferase